MFVRCGVILIVRVFFYIFTSLTTTTTPSLHPDAITLVVGGVQEGLGVSFALSERCERVCHRSANESQRRTMLLFLFEGRSSVTPAPPPPPPWSNQRTWRPFWPITGATSAFAHQNRPVRESGSEEAAPPLGRRGE